MKLAVIGHGYVGLITASVFADLGNDVVCVGRTKSKIDQLNKGIPTFFEPGLKELLDKNIKADRLKFTLNFAGAVSVADVVFIAVGTPSKDNGEADLSQVFKVTEEIGKNLSGYTVVGCKSTVPVGTNIKVGKILKENIKRGVKYNIASVPEFLREGTAISDTLYPDRVVIGTDSKKAESLLMKLHSPIGGERVLTDIASAEMIKYASNSLLATKISFANSIAFVSELVGADATEVLKGAGLDERIGKRFLSPGPGYGGSCFPKDVKALISFSSQSGYDFKILRAVHGVNEDAKCRVVVKIADMLGSLKNKNIAILGLAFKPDTDDMRDAPSIYVISKLLEAGAKVTAYDPQAVKNAKRVLPESVVYAKNVFSAVKGADIMVVLTEWREFTQVSLSKIKGLLRKPNIVDTRNIYNPEEARRLGFNYVGVGSK